MTDIQFDAHPRARQACAKSTLVGTFRSLLSGLLLRRKGKHLKHLSDHLARDIGISPTQMEQHRIIWPSESTDRPRL